MTVAGYLDVDHKSRIAIAYATSIMGGAALNITVPLFFELIMESIYGWAGEKREKALQHTPPFTHTLSIYGWAGEKREKALQQVRRERKHCSTHTLSHTP
jgi:hypothetical protein